MPIRFPTVLKIGPGGVRRLRAGLGEADRAMASGDWPLAEARYAVILATEPHRWPLHVQRGHALKEQGFLRKAEASYRQALALKPDAADTHLQLGHALKLQGRIPEAMAAYAQAALLAPDDADSRREIDALRQTASTALDASPAEAERRLMAAADLIEALLPRFDEAFYVQANPMVRRDLPSPNRLRCLAHFCAVGLAAVLPFNGDLVFDPDFYRDHALGGRALPPAAAYRHWLTMGLAQERSPNRADWLARHCGIGPRGTAMLPPATCDALIAIETQGDWIDAFEAMRAAGTFAEQAPGRAGLIEAFGDRAARFAMDGGAKRATGTRIDAGLLAIDPENTGALRRTAGQLRRQGFFQQARPLFEKLAASKARALDDVLGLADCLESAGDPEAALWALAEVRRNFPGEARLEGAVDSLAPRLLHRAFRLAMATGLADRVAEAEAALARAVDHVIALTETAEPALVPRPIRSVAILGNSDLAQCRFYRIEGKLEQLAEAGFAATFYDARDGVPAFLGDLYRHDAAIFYRVPADYHVITAIVRSRAAGLLTLYETDDLNFDAAHFPEPLDSYGGAIDAREHMGLRLGVPLFAAAMRLCDIGLASTPALAEAMRPLVRTGQVVVQRNAMGRAHEASIAGQASIPSGEKVAEGRMRGAGRSFENPSSALSGTLSPLVRGEGQTLQPQRDPGRNSQHPVTILYASGTKAHAADFSELVAPTLADLVRRHGDRVRIVLVGHVPAAEALEGIAHAITRHPMLPLADFWALLAQADINLAMLKPSTMADAKSEIKWLEAAMFSVPSVVSDTSAMRDAIADGVDGFLCRTPRDWVLALERLIAEPDLRQRVGAAARDAANACYGRATAAENIATILRRLSPPPAPKKPKLLVVNVYYPPQAIGGATRVVQDNVGALAARGAFDVEVFTSTDMGGAPYSLSTVPHDGVRVTAAMIPARDDIDRVLDDPAMGAAFAAFLTQCRPDLIHFHCIQRLTVAVVEAALAAGIPYLITAHDGWWVSDEQFVVDRFGNDRLFDYDDSAGTGRRLGAAAETRLRRLAPALRGATKVLAVSDAFAGLYRGCGVPCVASVPNGLSAGIAGCRRPAPTPRLRLGFVGGLQVHKGWNIVEAALRAEAFDGFELIAVDHALPAGATGEAIFGTTPVRFVPRRPPSEVESLFGSIDVLLAPSVWPESFGLVTREALACGCWVIASDRGAIGADVEPGHNGFRIDASSHDGLVEALRHLAADPERYRRAPPPTPLRTSAAQADELATLYASLLTRSDGRESGGPSRRHP